MDGRNPPSSIKRWNDSIPLQIPTNVMVSTKVSFRGAVSDFVQPQHLCALSQFSLLSTSALSVSGAVPVTLPTDASAVASCGDLARWCLAKFDNRT